MIHFTEYEIDRLIEEDLPYFDLTTDSLGINDMDAVMTFTARKELIVSCSEEVARILQKFGVQYVDIVSSGKSIESEEVILAFFIDTFPFTKNYSS